MIHFVAADNDEGLNLSINLCVLQVSVVLQGQDDIRGEKEEQLPEWTR